MAGILESELPYTRYAGQASHPLAADIGLAPGDYILHIDDAGNAFIIDSDDIAVQLSTGAGGAAPIGATYIVQTSDGTLTDEQALADLDTGLVKNTTGTGELSIAEDGVDYLSPTAIGDSVEAFSTELDQIAALSPTDGDFMIRESGSWSSTNFASAVSTAADSRAIVWAIALG